MKNLLRKLKTGLVLSVLSIGTGYFAFAQQETIAWDKIPVIQSPQVWSFMKYGNMSSVDLYTGTVATSIPIYTYKDNDFEIPISINYASSGFIPNVPTGILGLGWYLNAGGCITREVRGIPDEKYTIIGSIGHYGYLLSHWHFTTISEWDNVVAYNNRPGNSVGILSIQSSDGEIGNVETLSDIYHFRFGSHQGSFCLGPNNKIYVYNSDNAFGEYNIDMFIENDKQIKALKSNSVMTIVITDGLGYKYTFNGVIIDDNEIDHNVITDLRNSNKGPYHNYICNTFMLRTIESPNRRKVEFEYSDSIKYDIIKPHIYDLESFCQKTSAKYKYESSKQELTQSVYFIKQNTINITNIKIDNKNIITFLYDDKISEKGAYKSNVGSTITKTLNGNRLLSGICVYNADAEQEIMHCELTYKTNKGSGNPITFLKSVKVNQESEYGFSYYNEDEKFPFHGTPHMDHWGYYNNSTYNHSLNINDLLVDFQYDIDLNEYFDSDKREPDANGAKYGMLSKIFYPTGGWTEYIYEGNTYSQKVYRNNNSRGLPALFPANIGGCRIAKHKGSIYEAGGLRVKKIINHFSNETQSCKEYFYEDNDVSSGILLHYPRYKFSYQIYYTDAHNSLDTAQIVSCTDLLAMQIDKRHIAYSKVIEKLDNGAFIKYNYLDYAMIPDDTTSTRFKTGAYYGFTINSLNPEYLDNYYYPGISHSARRGKLKSKELFAADSTLVRKIEYSYNSQMNSYAEGLNMLHTTCYIDKVSVGNFPLSKERQVDYCGSDSIVLTRTYVYNSVGQLIKQKISDGNLFRRKCIYYPTDVSKSPIIDTLIKHNMINYPIREFTTLGKKSTLGIMDNGIVGLIKHEDIVEAYEREYKMQDNLRYPVLSSILKATIAEPVSLGSIFPNLDYKIYRSFDIYDKYGNIIQITSYDNIKTIYIWGYNGRYPVAVIENADLDIIKRIEGLDNIESVPLSTGLSEKQEQQLRALPDAHVTTYTYKPLVGITSVTDPSGRRKNYEYDSSGRLITIKDEEGKILDRYDYQYKCQIE